MDVDFQFGLLRGKVRVKKNPPRSGMLSEINEARPLSKQMDCKLNLTNLVFRVVLYHSLGIVYNAGNYSSVDMQ